MQCQICGEAIKETFLKKIRGTYVRVGKKLFPICSKCQKIYSKEEILKKLKEK